MTLLALTAEQVALNGKAWVEAITAILEAIIVKVGVLGLAAIAVYQNINKQLPPEVKERLDRQSARIDRVAIATVAAAPEEKKAEVAAAVAPAPPTVSTPITNLRSDTSSDTQKVEVVNEKPISVTEAEKQKPEKP